MAITLNGTTGITTPDITSDSYTGPLNVSASAPDNSLVVDSAGNVGIGTSSPSTGYGGTIANVKLALKNSGAGGNNGTSTLLIGGDNNHYSYLLAEHTGGGSTYLAFGTASGANNPTERARIDSAGRVTMPYQPRFFAYASASSSASGAKVPFDVAPLNVGSAFNTSTNTFTAPAAGTYYLSTLVRYNQLATTYSQHSFMINGAVTFQGHYNNTTNAAQTYSGVSAVALVTLAAGDTVYVQALSSAGGTLSYSGSESNFFGYLVG